RAVRVGGFPRVRHRGPLFDGLPLAEGSAVGRDRTIGGRDWRGVHHCGVDHRAALGEDRVGRLVGLGAASHAHAPALADLHRVLHAAQRYGEPGERETLRGGPGDRRGGGHPPHPPERAMVPLPAPAARRASAGRADRGPGDRADTARLLPRVHADVLCAPALPLSARALPGPGGGHTLRSLIHVTRRGRRNRSMKRTARVTLLLVMLLLPRAGTVAWAAEARFGLPTVGET